MSLTDVGQWAAIVLLFLITVIAVVWLAVREHTVDQVRGRLDEHDEDLTAVYRALDERLGTADGRHHATTKESTR